MDADPPPATYPPPTGNLAVDTAIRFLTAIFDEKDLILYRPIEAWTEGGRKHSRVDYRHIYYRNAMPVAVYNTVSHLLETAEKENTNLFFSACPRFGNKGRFDLAWQIRTVRALWADIDHVTIDEVRERLSKSQLPQPSIVVNSGNGVHLYWLLDEPYLIDDVGDPPPVETEWLQGSNGRKKPRRYILENGDKVYLDQRKHLSRLSAKAQHIQNVLAGIAQAVGGDHTKDLSRLLRVPGTLNRKDQRNGKEPVPTALLECEPTRRYPISAFESLAIVAPETERATKIAAMSLPSPRRLSPSKGDKLSELINASAIAPPGGRSEADFSVCCYAVRNGIAQEEVWQRVEQVGKFAEQGRRYFDLTWENAEYEARVATFEKLQKKVDRAASTMLPSTEGEADEASPPAVANRDDDDPAERPTITVDPANMPVNFTMSRITDSLLRAGNCFSRTEQLVVINQETIWPILKSTELAGLLNHLVEFYFIDDESGEYKPLPSAYSNTWLNHPGEQVRLPVIKLFTRNPVFTTDMRLVAPGFDQASGIYYAGPAVEAREGTEHLDTLLRDFCFKSVADRTNYLGVLLTAVLMPKFIGSKPAVLFNGNQPELGKSILAQIISILRDGQVTETASYNPNDEEFEKRLGAIVRGGSTTIIIDNAKTQGRNPRIESACLERSITDPILSFRLLGQSDSIRAENSHIFCITANSPDVGRDIVTRSVVVNLYHEGSPERRTFSMDDPEGYALDHRTQILGELIGMVERWKAAGMPTAKVHSRFNKLGWGTVIGGILHVCGEPDFLANADEAAAQLDDVRREFVELVQVLIEHPQGNWTAAELVELCEKHGLLTKDLGEGSPRSLSTKMGTLAGRFVNERFALVDGQQALFRRSPSRKGSTYDVVLVDEVPNLEGSAEPLPNLAKVAGSAP